jgi:hypothetical protein
VDLARAVLFRSAALAAALALGGDASAAPEQVRASRSAPAPRALPSTADIRITAIPAARRTEWSPGIPGGIPSRTKICATVPAEPLGNGQADAAAAIQKAIDACPEGQVVYLPPGTYRLAKHLVIPKGIVLRGAGPKRTRLRAEVQGTAVIYMTNLWVQYDAPPVAVTADVPKGAREIPVADTSGFSVGDIVQIDQLDDTYVYRGGLRWFIRGPNPGDNRRPVSRDGYRCQGQTVEVVGKTRTTLRIGTPIHLGFKRALRPEVYAPSGPRTHSGPTVRWAGLEDLYVTGGRSGMILMLAAAYSWIRNVESDGSLTTGRGQVGHHVDLESCYRCVVRDSYVHDASDVIQGGGAYGISVNSQSSECLVENNIVVNLNKPLVTQASGGGNVIAYNYVDDASTRAAPSLQETTIDAGHAAFPHMELFEGNWAGHVGTDVVWGNSGWITFFRNYASGEQRRSRLAGERWDVAAIGLEGRGVELNVVGNVLGAPGRGLVYEVTSSPPGTGVAAVYRIGHRANGGAGTGDVERYEDPRRAGSTASTLLRHGNFDHVTGKVRWDPGIRSRELPPSLYLKEKPPFFRDDPWPWVDPTGPEKIHVLPAKRRFDELSRVAAKERDTP